MISLCVIAALGQVDYSPVCYILLHHLVFFLFGYRPWV